MDLKQRVTVYSNRKDTDMCSSIQNYLPTVIAITWFKFLFSISRARLLRLVQGSNAPNYDYRAANASVKWY